MTQLTRCHICGARLVELEGYTTATQVTSDCRPWREGGHLAVCSGCETVQKPVTENWLSEVQEIYAGYAVYGQGGGVEQASFDQNTGASMARSLKIVNWLQSNGTLRKTGALLDIGCGNGAFLRAFGLNNPHWQMTGLELDSRNQTLIESIAGVTKLHVGPLESLQTRFDLIVLIHALEHIPDPINYLKSLSGLLNPGGLLLIEVPDIETSPFDILIADHCTHFSSITLGGTLSKAGFEVFGLEAGSVVTKELTSLARYPALSDQTNSDSSEVCGKTTAMIHIAWLQQLLEQGQSATGPVGIFGTSISATWLAAALGSKVGFFVDEDINRTGRRHMGYPIYSPKDAPKNSVLLMPLRTDIATAVAQRLAQYNLQFTIPSAPSNA
ncbi:MAG: class I SAM-dependent methyltransferase [Rhodospirillales bacterium]|nr:class I SAM-dependent methyltransferase [Rhodospirillales bacterium]